jgi:uncharacterized protein YndB with AHSA1/START domain
MIRNEHEVVINSSAERVFKFIADLDNWRGWRPGLQEVEKTTQGAVDVGTIWKVTGQVQGQPIVTTIEVIEYEANRRFGFKTTAGPIQARQVFTFKPVAGGMQLNIVLDLTDPELAPAAKQQWDNDLVALKELLEAPA